MADVETTPNPNPQARMSTPTADSLLELERKLEGGILECLRVLEQGRKESLQELRQAAKQAGVSASAASSHLRSLVSESVAHVEAVQRELGALNLALDDFVLSDELNIENLQTFDTWRDRVLSALQESQRGMAGMKREGDQDETWSQDLESVWDHFRQRLELVRIRLQADEASAAEEFAALRARLEELRSQLAQDPKKAREQLRHLSAATELSADWRRLDGWIKALLMWRERGQQ